jgi:amino acid transporter
MHLSREDETLAHKSPPAERRAMSERESTPATPRDETPSDTSFGQATARMFAAVRRLLLGRARDPLDPRVFHQISLIAFFAWVGLGADGLSSSAYGPEEAYLALGQHHGLAVLLALATMFTVTVISASYFQIIDLFPSGGGGYVVASKLLGSGPGLLSGCALIVDYALTIAISLASAMDALFSLLPIEWHPYRAPAVFASLALLTVMNLRGVKESIRVLTPVFLLFVFTHVLLLAVAIFSAPRGLTTVPEETLGSIRESVTALGILGTFAVLFRAYSLGAGTYTGIEAVSNGLSILRAPHTTTGKRTMVYMGTSLSLTAGGLLIAYLIHHVVHHPGRTLNATLSHEVFGGWHLAGLPAGAGLVLLTLVSEGAILVVAAQAGFVDGPRVLANMALDQWVPRRFANLSERLVTQDGILLMAASAAVMLAYTHTAVRILVVLYSINVFITFGLSQLGMVRHWWQVRGTERGWRRRLAINGVGLLLCTGILLVTTAVKFTQGGWVALVVTGAAIVICKAVRRHYRRVARYTARLDTVLTSLPVGRHANVAPVFDPNGRTAVLLVSGFNGLGMHSLLSILKLFAGHFQNFVFVEVGVLDFGRFKGVHEVEALREVVEKDLSQYVEHMRGMGIWATSRWAIGREIIQTAADLCQQVAKEMPRPMIFASRLVYQEENFASRALHGETALSLQRRLHFLGIPFMVLPIRAM